MTETTNPATTGNTEATTTTNSPGSTTIQVGANSAYNSIESLIEGKRQADAYIAQQSLLIKQLQEELTKANNREEFQKQLQAQLTNPAVQSDGATTPISEDKLKQMLNTVLAQNKKQESLDKRLEDARSLFGDEAENKLEARASELGLSKDALLDLPEQAYVALMGVSKPTGVSTLESRQQPIIGGDETEREFAKKILDPSITQSPRALGELIEQAIKNPELLKYI